MKNKQGIIFGIGITVAIASGFMFGQYVTDKKETSSEAIRAMVPESPRKLAFPALQQDSGSFDMTSLQGKWSLLFFGYTHCPDICPTTLATIAEARKKVTQADGEFPQVVFISVDPARDTAEMLGEYVRYYDKDFIGITGEEKLLRAITVQMSSSFIIEASDNPARYMVGHSLNLILINPEVELVAILKPPHTVRSILDALQYFKDGKQ